MLRSTFTVLLERTANPKVKSPNLNWLGAKLALDGEYRPNLEDQGVGKDKSMSFWTPEKLGEKAKEDAENDNYNPPHSWVPGRYRVGTEARDGYDRAFNLHHSDKDEC
jgi:hypothetical protein